MSGRKPGYLMAVMILGMLGGCVSPLPVRRYRYLLVGTWKLTLKRKRRARGPPFVRSRQCSLRSHHSYHRSPIMSTITCRILYMG